MDADAIAPPPPPGAGIGVVGAGTMGQGIAHVFAAAGFPVHLTEPDTGRARGARDTSAALAADAAARRKLSYAAAVALVGRIALLPDAVVLPVGLALVGETLPGRAALKRRVLPEIAARMPMVIASNASSMSIDALSASVADPARFLGMQFFTPVPALGLLEPVRGTATSAGTLVRARGCAGTIGKTTVTVNDTPGFATSRLDLVQALEAIRMVEAGVAWPEEIDRAVTTAYRHPLGPLRLSEMVGLDAQLDIARQLEAALGPRCAPPRLLEEVAAQGCPILSLVIGSICAPIIQA